MQTRGDNLHYIDLQITNNFIVKCVQISKQTFKPMHYLETT